MADDLSATRITVMGLGRFGGGVGVSRWLAEAGADVLITDLARGEDLSESIAQIRDLIDRGTVRMRLGEHNVSDFTNCDLVVANPAVPKPWTNRYLRSAEAAGIRVTTEIRLLMERLDPKQVIGVTGTAGKSTTTAMIHHILIGVGKQAHLGGNIGGSLLLQLNRIAPSDPVVVELSSAMLYWLGRGVGHAEAPGMSPQVAVLTNIEPNHLDWHGSIEHYRQSKRNVFAYQDVGTSQIITADLEPPAVRIPLKIPGEHSQRNAMTAIAAARCTADITFEEAAALLGNFPGLPHRMQLAIERDGMRFYNDSKSTTPKATLLAVDSFDDARRVHLIAGGYDKKIDLSTISKLAERLAGLYTVGQTGQMIATAVVNGTAHVEHCETLDVAVEHAMARMRANDVLLLSPGCASWDQFDNYEKRGDAFVSAVAATSAVYNR